MRRFGRKGMLAMTEREKEHWQTFTRTGQVRDYLRYLHCRPALRDEPNPRRRIQDSSKYKNFY